VLYDSRVIIEYLDERFPHPSLMPADPVTRARFRLALYRIERDWYSLLDQIGQEEERRHLPKLRKMLLDTIVQGVELFQLKPFFLSDEFSLVDATLAPVLWRLPYYQIELPPKAQPIVRYQSRIFARPGFVRALSDAERAMHR